MYHMVWTTLPNIKKKEFVELSSAVHEAICAQFPAKVYKKRKIVAEVDKNGVKYY